jgi:hypothetical protein
MYFAIQIITGSELVTDHGEDFRNRQANMHFELMQHIDEQYQRSSVFGQKTECNFSYIVGVRGESENRFKAFKSSDRLGVTFGCYSFVWFGRQW